MSGTMKKWEGKWDELVGKAKSKWGDLTDDEIAEAKGDAQQLLGIIKRKSGEAAEEIEKKLNSDD